MPEAAIDLRPRSTGEVLDDAWRLALADAPVLLAFEAAFLVPAFAALLLLLARPQPDGLASLTWPAITALLMALGGIGSGACQEWLRRGLEGQSPRALPCLGAALRQGLDHAAARALVLAGVLAGLFLLLMPGLSLWAAAAPVHALIASGRGRRAGLVGELAREAAFDPTKAAVVVLVRLPLLLLAALNIHILLLAALWAAEAFAGLQTALLSVQLSLFSNSVYTVGLFLLCWLLLSPFFEASNFLLHLDTRTRQEGIDLLYRIQRVFHTEEPAAAGPEPALPAARSVRTALLAAAALFLAGPASAEETERDVVHAVRLDVNAIREEIRTAEPYPGGGPWEGRLRAQATRLQRVAATRYAWFRQALDGFAQRSRLEALRVLADLDGRLALHEDSLAPRSGPDPQRVKSLLRRDGTTHNSGASASQKKAKEEREKAPDELEDQPRRGVRVEGRAAVSHASWDGLGFIGWGVVVGLAAAILIAAGYLFWTNRNRPRVVRTPVVPAIARTLHADLPRPGATSAGQLWEQGEALAGQGKFPEAMRLLYLAVLFDLDRRQLLHYEPTRTNGEYIRQVCLAEQAPAQLHETFERLTGQFDRAWYGGRQVLVEEYQTFRGLAGEVRDGTTAA